MFLCLIKSLCADNEECQPLLSLEHNQKKFWWDFQMLLYQSTLYLLCLHFCLSWISSSKIWYGIWKKLRLKMTQLDLHRHNPGYLTVTRYVWIFDEIWLNNFLWKMHLEGFLDSENYKTNAVIRCVNWIRIQLFIFKPLKFNLNIISFLFISSS